MDREGPPADHDGMKDVQMLIPWMSLQSGQFTNSAEVTTLIHADEADSVIAQMLV